METVTTLLPEPPQSEKVSSFEDELLELKRLQLAKMNRLKGGETPEQVSAAWEQFEIDRENRRQRERDQQEQDKRELMLRGLRGSLRAFGIDPPEDADEELLRQLVKHHGDRAEAERREVQRLIDEQRHWARADQLFSCARFPERAIKDLQEYEIERNGKWTEIRDLLVEQSEYASGFLVGLLGIRGVGKTVLATSVARRCCDQLMTARYVKALDLFRDFRGAYTPVKRGERGESEEDIVSTWAAYDLLVVDELHQRADTTYENNSLINLLDLRYDACKCTILIANQSKAEFSEAMGDSVVSRIHQTGEVFECDWPTYRKPGSWRQEEGAAKRTPSGVLRSVRHDN